MPKTFRAPDARRFGAQWNESRTSIETVMNQFEEFEALASAMALGALSAADTAQFARHLDRDGAEDRQTLAELRRIDYALAWTPAAATPPAGVKDRLLQSIANLQTVSAPNSGFAFVRADEGAWQQLAPGVTAKHLFDDATAGSSTMLVRMAAGSTVPGHRHEDIEELLVLEGDCYCAGQRLQTGDYHRAESGSTHGVTFTEQGCMMIVHTSSGRPAKKA